ncbi:hypothetical protein HBI56_079820 [Parastagonospora nodorum]|nr:hypothetical protein HBH53_057440 [Parastagonospora nodorum]KAH4898315.1 hypothetical protein HBI80_185360 [Parastagonospora nodorum]KAH4986175.1 hypothetical protein HBI76_116250 [Parastagonospora nodorum]KAH5159167.1 hypothetical protein HBI73_055530 [Parastagonospora nodorum]KAH5190821.1 hypothetical protein HBH76_088840 [Parastagonospora nodorum]
MSCEEVQMHEKHEATASIIGKKNRRNMFGRKMKARKENQTHVITTTTGPRAPETIHDSKKHGLWRRMKKGIKKMLAPRERKTASHASDLQTGFHCASISCPSCALPPAIPPALELSLHALSTPLIAHPITETTSLSSGLTTFTSSSSASSTSSPKLPTIHIPPASSDIEVSPKSSAMHDIFADFNGVYCSTDTLDPIRPVSAFVEKIQGTRPSSSLPGMCLDSTGPCSPPHALPLLRLDGPSEIGRDVSSRTSLPLLQYASTPPTRFVSSSTSASSPAGTWPTRHLDTPCPTHRQSVWSFDLVAPDSAFEAVGNKGDGAGRTSG